MLNQPKSKTPIRWHVTSEGWGATHQVNYKGFTLIIENYSGSDTIMTSIIDPRFEYPLVNTNESRYEGGVKSNKQRLIEKADKIHLDWQRTMQAKLDEQRA